MVDPGGGGRRLELLQTGDVGELVFQDPLYSVNRIFSRGPEGVQAAGQVQVGVLVGGETGPADVDDEVVGGEEVSSEDGFGDVGNLEIPRVAASLELEGNHPRSVALDLGPPGPHQVVAGRDVLPGRQLAPGEDGGGGARVHEHGE